MEKIAIVTDSNSGITQEKAKKLGIRVLPMPFYIDGELFYEDITLTQEEFYQRLAEDADISTSQPSPAEVTGLWDEVLQDNDKIIYIPMSSGLSSSCETAMGLARDYEGKVYVVDNQRISITQQQSVWDAIEMRDKGMSAEEIVDVLMREKLEASIYITVDTLKYLKKGGRVTPAAAAIGTVLNLKPVLTIQGEKLDAFAKVRGIKAAKKTMLDAMEKDIKERFAGKEVHLEGAYTCSDEAAQEWKQEIAERLPGYDIVMDRLSLSVSCHIGPGAIAIACSKKIEL
ncbi:MAG TPA: DegV family protein [Candidatus Dorea merdavium]|nr:DegV family protein [Candidatus Dorea merdavium]